MTVRPIRFLGDSLKAIRAWPETVRHEAGYQLSRLQHREQPDDFKPLPAVGPGVEELRIRSASGAFRVVYLSRRAEAVYVLHAFTKKSQATTPRDLALARQRLKAILEEF